MKPNEEIRIFEHTHLMDGLKPVIYTENKPPYVSLYIPVDHNNRAGGRSDWDRIEYKDLKKQAILDLERDYQPEDYHGIIERLDFLEEHPDWFVWENAVGGMAFLISNTEIFVFSLTFKPEPMVTVGDTFFMKPLFRNFEDRLHYYILALSNDRFGFIEGDEEALHRLPMPKGVHDEFSEEFADYNGTEGALDYVTLEGHMSPYHGWLSRNEVKQEEGIKFFRYVNKAVDNAWKLHDPTPVIIASLPEHQKAFRDICTIHDVLPEGIMKDPGGLDAPTLLADAVAIMTKHRDEAIAQVIDTFDYDQSQGKASSDVKEIGKALFDKKVATLLVQEGKVIPGTYDPATGDVEFDPALNPLDDKKLDPASPDLIDGLAQAALQQGGRVIVLPEEKMPGGNVAAAIYRY